MIKYDNFENLTINKHANRQGVSCDYPSAWCSQYLKTLETLEIALFRAKILENT